MTTTGNDSEPARAAEQHSAPVRLAEVLANRRWLWRRDPFPHVLAHDVFRESVSQALTRTFGEILARGVSESFQPERFSRVTGYDAYSYPFSSGLDGQASLFLSREWHDVIARLWGVPATGDIRGSFHHHRPGSANGSVHNDFNPGWFAAPQDGQGVNVADHNLCSYYNGKPVRQGVSTRERVRAVAVIYYLNNPSWNPADGGETGLYRMSSDPVDQPAIAIPPRNNSMLQFECTPYSFHSFLANRRQPRNSLIMWLHRPKDDAVRRWGEQAIAYWRSE